jgi:hypothetical protein
VNRDLEKALVHDFPSLYRGRHLDVRKGGRGFAVEDGWERIIRRLSERLEPTFAGTSARLSKVKERSGVLWVTMVGTSRDDAEVKRLIAKAERASTDICELCGAQGRLRMLRGYAVTQCDHCLETCIQERRWM